MTKEEMNQALLETIHKLELSEVSDEPFINKTFTQATCPFCKKFYLVEFGCKHD